MAMQVVRDADELKLWLVSIAAPPDVAAAFVAAARAPEAIAADAQLGALIKQTDSQNRVVKVTCARLRNWVVNWKTVLFDLAPSLATAAVSPSIVVKILALLKALKGMLDASSVTLEEREANLVAEIWSQPGDIISKEAVREKLGFPNDQFELGLDRLLAMRVIDIEDDARIRKTEWMIMV